MTAESSPRSSPHSPAQIWWERARQVIPAGTQTFSKGPDQLAPGFGPKFLVRGQGSRVWDVDGNEYVDLTMGLLPLILGYSHPLVDEAVRRQLSDGSTFSLMHPLEVEVAETICEIVPCAEMVRFAKNGSDATAGAVRLARAATGREIVACCGYHGSHDWYIGTTSRNLGVPRAVASLTKPFRYNEIESLEGVFNAHPGQVAAVILEPITFEEPKGRFLQEVRDLTHRHGAVLIFDEIVTGFRFELGGAQQRFDVVPDLSTFGKAVANGLPLSGIAGRRELMELFDTVFFSFTFAGEVLSLAAAKATIAELRETGGPRYLEDLGRQLQDGVRELIRTHSLEAEISCPGLPSWTCLAFHGDDPNGVKTLIQQECLRRGVLFMANHNLSTAHSTHDIDAVLAAYDAAFGLVAGALADDGLDDVLVAERVQPVFRPVSM